MSKEQEISELERKKMSIQNKERKKSVCISLFFFIYLVPNEIKGYVWIFIERDKKIYSLF